MTDLHDDPWEARMERALALLAERLDAPPDLHALAAAAGISAYHFHRIWRALTGETVGDSIARLRIAAAQVRLAAGGESVTGVAMESGYGTPQSFARAFRRVTGMSPSAFVATGAAPVNVTPPPDADIRIELRAPGELVALRREGGGYRELNALYGQLWDWAAGAGKLDGLQGIYGLLLDDPESVPEARQRYDAALALADPGIPEPPLRIVSLPGGEHAVLRHVGSHDALEPVNQRLIAWLVASGRMPGDFPLIHHALDDPDETPEAELRTDVLVLLAPEERP
ncbi:GyrI-like domain-containing protein [Sphingomonas sp. CJ20]